MDFGFASIFRLHMLIIQSNKTVRQAGATQIQAKIQPYASVRVTL